MPRSRLVPAIAFAHRGARSELPENTIPAFRLALELGASGLESDAWLAADGEVVLVHDGRVRRGVRRLAVESTPSLVLAEGGVPRLADLYAECGTDYELSLDCKASAAARPVIELARAAGAAGRLWLCSPSVRFLTELRAEAPDIRLVHSPGKGGIASAVMERHAADLAARGIDCVNLHHTDWTLGLVTLFHRFGLRVFAWDAQETRHLRSMLRMGIDGVYCDRVDRMVAAVGEWSG